jgi:hypothetical protein
MDAQANELVRRFTALLMGACPPFSVTGVALGKLVASTMAGVREARQSKEAAKVWLEMFYEAFAKHARHCGIEVNVQLFTETPGEPPPPKDDDDEELLRKLNR